LKVEMVPPPEMIFDGVPALNIAVRVHHRQIVAGETAALEGIIGGHHVLSPR
jgi:hypothetical protein